jgi:hypothetical protein
MFLFVCWLVGLIFFLTRECPSSPLFTFFFPQVNVGLYKTIDQLKGKLLKKQIKQYSNPGFDTLRLGHLNFWEP